MASVRPNAIASWAMISGSTSPSRLASCVSDRPATTAPMAVVSSSPRNIQKNAWVRNACASRASGRTPTRLGDAYGLVNMVSWISLVASRNARSGSLFSPTLESLHATGPAARNRPRLRVGQRWRRRCPPGPVSLRSVPVSGSAPVSPFGAARRGPSFAPPSDCAPRPARQRGQAPTGGRRAGSGTAAGSGRAPGPRGPA